MACRERERGIEKEKKREGYNEGREGGIERDTMKGGRGRKGLRKT